MSWKTIVHTDPPIIETCYSGSLTKSELFAAAHETLALGQEHGRHLFLGDCSNLTSSPSVFDLYQLAKKISLDDFPHILREALLLPKVPAFIESVNFWETIGRNRGFAVRVFKDRKTALNWLLSDQG